MANTFTDVYAVPGANSIIDGIHPTTGLTLCYHETAEQVRERYPDAVRMTWDAWQASAAARQQTPIYWQPTTAGKFNEMLNVLPPAMMSQGAFLVGEPDDHDFATGAPRFTAYRQSHGLYFVASRPITRAELRKELESV